MAITHQQAGNQYSTPTFSIYKKIKSLLVVMLIIGLVTSNIATLINDTIHNRIYGTLSRLVDALPNFHAKKRILQNSPTSHRRADVRKATVNLQTEKNALAKKNQILSNSNDALFKKNRKLTSEHSALIKSNADLTQRHINLNSKHSALKNNFTSLAKQLAALKNNFTSLAKQLAMAKRSNKELQETNRKRTAKVQDFSKRMSSRSVNFAKRNIASLPAEFIPMVGTSVIVAVTAYDIYALCDSMRDINNLNQTFGLAHEKESTSTICGIKPPDKDSVWREVKENTQNSIAKAKEYVAW